MSDDVNHLVSPAYTNRGWVPIDIGKHLYMCSKCKALAHPGNEPDPCLGELVGVDAACCGHGHISYAYVVCHSTVRQRDYDAVTYVIRDRRIRLSREEAELLAEHFGRKERMEILYGRNAVVALLGWPRRRRPQEKGE